MGWDTLKYDWNRCLRAALFVFWLLHLLHRIFVYATWETVQIGAQPSFLVFISKHKIDRKIFLFSYWINRCSRCRSQKKNFSQTLEFFLLKISVNRPAKYFILKNSRENWVLKTLLLSPIRRLKEILVLVLKVKIGFSSHTDQYIRGWLGLGLFEEDCGWLRIRLLSLSRQLQWSLLHIWW